MDRPYGVDEISKRHAVRVVVANVVQVGLPSICAQHAWHTRGRLWCAMMGAGILPRDEFIGGSRRWKRRVGHTFFGKSMCISTCCYYYY